MDLTTAFIQNVQLSVIVSYMWQAVR